MTRKQEKRRKQFKIVKSQLKQTLSEVVKYVRDKKDTIFKISKNIVLILIIGAMLPLISFIWEVNLGVSISSQTAINPNNPLSTYFTFSNGSHFVLTNMRSEYNINTSFVPDEPIKNVKQTIYIPGQLKPGHATTTNALISVNSNNINARMYLDVYYRPKFLGIVWKTKHDSFNFQLINTANGYSWIEQDYK